VCFLRKRSLARSDTVRCGVVVLQDHKRKNERKKDDVNTSVVHRCGPKQKLRDSMQKDASCPRHASARGLLCQVQLIEVAPRSIILMTTYVHVCMCRCSQEGNGCSPQNAEKRVSHDGKDRKRKGRDLLSRAFLRWLSERQCTTRLHLKHFLRSVFLFIFSFFPCSTHFLSALNVHQKAITHLKKALLCTVANTDSAVCNTTKLQFCVFCFHGYVLDLLFFVLLPLSMSFHTSLAFTFATPHRPLGRLLHLGLVAPHQHRFSFLFSLSSPPSVFFLRALQRSDTSAFLSHSLLHSLLFCCLLSADKSSSVVTKRCYGSVSTPTGIVEANKEHVNYLCSGFFFIDSPPPSLLPS
jgi:hypothetical protein